MNCQAIKWTLAAGIATALTTLAAHAQHAEDDVTKVITLQYLDSSTAVDAIGELSIEDLYTVANAAKVNKLIVQGSPGAVKLVESVIAELDLAPEGGGLRDAMQTDFVPVSSYPLADMHKLVHAALDLDGPTRTAADEVNNRIVVTGTRKDIQAVRSLVDQLDRPRSTYAVEFFFIRSGGDGTATPLPKAMAPIASSLQKSGFGSLSLLAPLIVRVDDGGRFDQQARHTLRHDDGPPEQIELSVTGNVRSAYEGDSLRIELQAEMIGVTHQNSTSNAFFEISTELSIPKGRYAVLAAAPASTRDSDAVALVIHVTSGSFD